MDDHPDDEGDIEEIVLENAADCPGCGEVTGHEVLKERAVGEGGDYLVRCEDCSHVHTIHLRPPKPVIIPFMLSDGPTSSIAEIEIDGDEILRLEDIFEHDEQHWRITRIELKDGGTASDARGDEVVRSTALRADQVRIKLTMTSGEDSEADVIIAEPDHIFTTGKILEHDGRRWRIRAIHTGTGRTLNGSVPAARIKRIYLHEPESGVERSPHTPRERRQAWKEGRLGYNPNPIRPPSENPKGGRFRGNQRRR